MDLTHPIDDAIREKLRERAPNQPALADTIGRSQGWLNKYMNGDGNATIDDVIRIAAAFIAVDAPPLTGEERSLLRAFRRLTESDRSDVVAYAKHRETLAHRNASKESSAPAEHTPRETTRKARDKR